MVYLFLTKKTDSTDAAVAHLAREYCALVGVTEGDFTVVRAERGKPYFPNTPSIHFSVSHSGDIFACAFSDEPVGVDIQEYKIDRTKRSVAARSPRAFSTATRSTRSMPIPFRLFITSGRQRKPTSS